MELERQVNLDPGTLIVHAPSDFCIARGYRSFPSDHIVLPVYFENTGKGAKTIERLTLLNADASSPLPQRFLLAGYLPDFALDEFGEHYEVATGVTIPERSVERKVLVFHTEHWWDEASDDFMFRFAYQNGAANLVNFKLAYVDPLQARVVQWHIAQPTSTDRGLFLSMPLYETINKMTLRPTQVDNLLQQADTQSNPALTAALQAEPRGDYHIDCFSIGDFPDVQQP